MDNKEYIAKCFNEFNKRLENNGIVTRKEALEIFGFDDIPSEGYWDKDGYHLWTPKSTINMGFSINNRK